MEAYETGEGMPFGMQVERNADRVMIALRGEVTMEAGKRFENGLHEIERQPVHVLVVDLSGVTFLDSTGAFLLLEMQRRFEGRAEVTFEGGSPQVQGRLHTAGIPSILGDSTAEHPPRHPPHIGPGVQSPVLLPHQRDKR